MYADFTAESDMTCVFHMYTKQPLLQQEMSFSQLTADNKSGNITAVRYRDHGGCDLRDAALYRHYFTSREVWGSKLLF